MISKKYKAIFIHIRKTAGTSIEKKLGLFQKPRRGAQDHRKVIDYEKIALLTRKGELKRSLYYTLKKPKFDLAKQHLKSAVNPELSFKEYNSFFKFCFVRNSWSRTYSWYKNIMRDEIHRNLRGISEDCTLAEFIELLDHDDFTQLSYITDSKGDIPLDFIGRFENLQADFEYVCEQLQIKDPTLPKLLISDNQHYSNFFDNKSKDLVYKYYRKEIEYFNFTFGA